MDVEWTSEQQLLQQSAREFLSRECPTSVVREAMDDPGPVIDRLWKPIAELGWAGLVVPESHGGTGLGWVDLAALLEEAGRALLPAPLLATSLVAHAVARLGSDDQRDRILPALAEGRSRAAPAGLDRSGERPKGVSIEARADDGGWRLRGELPFVADALGADWLLLAARSERGPGLWLVDARREGVSVESHGFLDATRPVGDLRLGDGVAAERLAEGSDAVAWLLDHARAGLCAEMCGGASRVLELSVEYAKVREQFGRPIGSFQAIQHRCADLLVDVEAARSAAQVAAWNVAEGRPEARAAACLAKAFCGDAYLRVAAEGIQIHGGLGFTWEQDLHLFYKRALADQQAWGDATRCREEAARIAIDERGPLPV